MASSIDITIDIDDSSVDPAIRGLNAGFDKLGKSGEAAMKKIEAAQKRVLDSTNQVNKALSGSSTSRLGGGLFGSYSSTGQVAAYQKVAEGATRASHAVDGVADAHRRAHDAAGLLARTTGIELPRQMERLIAQSKILGPAFAFAFKATVVLAVLSIVVELIEKSAKWLDELRGITDELDKQKQLAIEINGILLGDQSSKTLSKAYGGLVQERKAARAELKKHRLFQSSPRDDASVIYDGTEESRYLKERLAELDKLIPETEKKVAEALKRERDEDARKHQEALEKKKEAAKRYAEETIQILKRAAEVEDRGRLDGLSQYEQVKEKERQEIRDLMELEKKRPQLTAQIEAAIFEIEKGAAREIRKIREAEAKKLAEEQKQAVEKWANEYEERLKHEKDFAKAMGDSEADIASLRKEIAGDTIGALRESEQRRVEDAVARMREIGIAEEKLADYRANLQLEANLRIAREQQKLLEQSVDRYASALEDLFSGNLSEKILANAKRFFFRLAALWLVALSGQRPNGGGAGTSGGGGILGGLGSILLGGGGSGSGGGGLVLGGGGTGVGVGATPPFNPNAGTGIGNNFIAPGLVYQNGEIVSTGGGATQGSGGSGGGIFSKIGGFFGGSSGVAQLGLLGAVGLGKKFGGIPGAIGGGIAALALTASLSNGSAGIGAANILSGLGIAPALAGPLAGGLIGFGVGNQFGKTAGILSGGLSGALVGGLAFGPVGAIIGGIVGLLGGLFGGLFGGRKRRKQANKYVDQTVVPEIEKIIAAYKGFQIDYGTAVANLIDLQAQSEESLKKLKGEGKDTFRKRVLPAIDQAKASLLGIENERQRRASLYFGPPQFHEGGFVSTSGNRQYGIPVKPGEVVAKLRDGEFVVNPRATRENRSALEAINNGGSVGGGSVHHHWDIKAVDAKSFADMLRRGGGKEIAAFGERAAMEGGF